MRVDFNLKASCLAPPHRGSMAKTDFFQAAAERRHMARERTAQIGGMAAGMKTAEVAIQFAFRGPDAGWIADDERSVDPRYGAARSRLRYHPVHDIVHGLQPGDTPQAQRRAFERDGRQAAGLPVPTEIHAEECRHACGISSTVSPTAIRPGSIT
jgi:hypothetical protein